MTELLEPEEWFIGAALQFPLYFIVGWWVLPIMLLCGLLWRLGGMAGSSKLFRKVGVPLVVCWCAFAATHHWAIFLAIPFMIWLNPASYGKSGWLWKIFKADLPVRLIGYFWYWSVFTISYLIK